MLASMKSDGSITAQRKKVLEERAKMQRLIAQRTQKQAASGARSPWRRGGFGRVRPGQKQEPSNVVLKRAKYRLLLALVVTPWVLWYVLIGAWAVLRSLGGFLGGKSSLDIGWYSGAVPTVVVFGVGLLVLCSCVVVVVIIVRVVRDDRGRALWQKVCLVASVFAAGPAVGAVALGIPVVYWLPFVGGVAYATLLAFVWRGRPPRSRRIGAATIG